jgi:hypothetical protein
MLLYESFHEGDAIRIIRQVDIYATGSQKIDIPREVPALSNDDSLHTKLQDGAGTHHARTKCRIESYAIISGAASCLSEAIHLTVSDWVRILYTPVMASGNCHTLFDHHGSDGQSALVI